MTGDEIEGWIASLKKGDLEARRGAEKALAGQGEAAGAHPELDVRAHGAQAREVTRNELKLVHTRRAAARARRGRAPR